jgi:2-keto-4-pentenoate hydratase/2-oxohepta-3-ene-1,7-dioic acid hydratase in catechol pathway
MKLVSFRPHDEVTIGALVGNRVADLVPASRAISGPDLPRDMIAFLEMGKKGLQAAHAAIRYAHTYPDLRLLVPASRAKFEAPVPCPRKLLCLAGNYAEHNVESGREARSKKNMIPRVFMKPPSTTVNRPGGDIVLGRNARFVDWEVELAIVMGKTAKHVQPRSASRYIAGYTIVNDISERDFRIRKRKKTEDFDRFFDWLNGKWPDGFAPMGPCITTRDEIDDPQKLAIRLDLNDETMQEDTTGSMIFNCREIVSFISKFVTLEPGDVIATGTPAGIGKAQDRKLEAGDTLRCEIEGIGVLENPVVAEKKPRKRRRRKR